MTGFISEALQHYLNSSSSAEPDYLCQIREETEREVHSPRMISGHYQGRLLALISKLVRPEMILEIGTYTGYSALCLAEGLSETGRLITIEKNMELKARIEKNFALTGLGGKITLLTGDAHEILKATPLKPDLVFMDADKRGYAKYYEALLPAMPSGGCMLVDNVLWSGRVLEPGEDKKAGALHEFNCMIAADDRVEKIMLPVRDGITLIRKK